MLIQRSGVQGAMLREKALEEAADMHEKERAARERAKRANWETARANDALRQFKLKELECDRAADKAIEDYAVRKASLEQSRRAREAERKAQKEARRLAMVRGGSLVMMMYLVTTVPHPREHWQLQELLGNQCYHYQHLLLVL